ncbi:phage terminase large subunit GpA-like protein [Agrobacterium vitis]|nr:phage terminase large subunit GpA-like protein [Agrobacterium vitis]
MEAITDILDHEELTVEYLRGEMPSLAHGGAVFCAAVIKAAEPEEELTVSQWADRYRKVSAESGSPFPGDWSTDRVPYLREPLDCLHEDHPARRVTLKFSAQTGKSEVGVCWFGYIVDRAPAPILTILPTLDEAVKYNRVKLQPTIDASPKIRHRVKAENSRDEGASTSSFKRFSNGFNQITTATSSKGLQMISVKYLIMDEVSGYPADTDGRGSPVDQARARQKAFGENSKELVVSTPGEVGTCRISLEYDAGDQRRLYMPCSQCGTFQQWPFEKMRGPAAGSSRPHFVCDNGCVVEQIDREAMLAAHRWVPTWVEEGGEPVPQLIAPEDIDHWAIPPCTGRVRDKQPSWAHWAAWSPFEPWAAIWQRSVEAFGDPAKLKVFTQQDLGEAYEAKSDTPDWEKLLACRTNYKRGVVPYPACVLYGFFDVQGNRFEWGLYAFGPGFQAWPVDRGVISHDYTSDEAWEAIDAITSRTWPTENGNELVVKQWGMDTGAYTQTLYDRVSRRSQLLACKGEKNKQAAPLKLTRADLKDERGNVIAGRRINLALIGNFDLKFAVYDGLRSLVEGQKPDGTWKNNTLHLPEWFGEDELKQLTAEVLVDTRTETNRNGKRAALIRPGDAREWRKRFGWANEGLDIAVGCRALAWGDGAGQIDTARWLELVGQAHGLQAKQSAQMDLFAKKPLPQQADEAKQAAQAQQPPQPERLPFRPASAGPTAGGGFVPRRTGWLQR